MSESINFTKETFEAFKKAYEKAVNDNVDMFIFDKKEIYVGYAKYVIEYLTPKFNS